MCVISVYLLCADGVQRVNLPVHIRNRYSGPVTRDGDPISFIHCQAAVCHADFRNIYINMDKTSDGGIKREPQRKTSERQSEASE